MDGSLYYSYWRNPRPYLYPTAMHVDYITVEQVNLGGAYQAKVTMRVVDSKDVPVSAAIVMASVQGPFNTRAENHGVSDSFIHVAEAGHSS